MIDRRPVVERALVLHPARAHDSQTFRSPRSRLDEAVGLARALDLEIADAGVVPLRSALPATLFGRGKVAEIGERCDALNADVVIVDDALTPVQQRNLEKAWDRKVIDRTGLILEIFARRARTREGKLQVELARLAYERSRLVRTWTHLERQRGGFGVMGGPGETQIETDRRLIAEKITRLKSQLVEVRRTRGLHRHARKRTPFPTIALVGYTNAGKSTLFNRLTAGGVLAKDMLFATLDPTLRELKLPGGRPAIMSDTVGFISDLPHELVESFRATLEEVSTADLVLHVRDVADPDTEAQALDVAAVLNRMQSDADPNEVAIDDRTIEVWNKIDLLEPEDRAVWELKAVRRSEIGRVAAAVSAETGEGCDRLLQLISERIDPAEAVDAVLSAHNGEALAWLYRNGRVLSRTDDDAGDIRVTVRLEPQALGRFERLYPSALRAAGSA